LAAGCNPPGKPDPKNRPVPADRVDRFDQLFKENCVGCHGPDGKGGPAPLLHDALFRASIPEEELRKVIASGRKGTPMPAFHKDQGGTLSSWQIQILVYEIKGTAYKVLPVDRQRVKALLKKKSKGGEELTTAEQKYLDRALPELTEAEGDKVGYTVEEDEEGTPPMWGKPEALPADAPPYAQKEQASTDFEKTRKGVFARACAVCHGDNGQGMRQGDRGAGAINNPAFLSLISDKALRRVVITGRPDLGMPNYQEKRGDSFDKPLTSQEVADIVALLTSWRQANPSAGK
jgi:mono/diheme cytochrome c family protein